MIRFALLLLVCSYAHASETTRIDGTIVTTGMTTAEVLKRAGEPDAREHDHMRPLSRGGVHSAANIAPCCLDCNSGKGAMTFDKWIARLAPKHRARAVAYFEKRNGSIDQGGLVLAA